MTAIASASSSTLTAKTAELAASQAAVAQLQKELETERLNRFKALPAEFGYASSDEFLVAYRAALKGSAKARTSRKARTEITDEVRNAIKAALVENTKTAQEIATAHGVSVGTVQNIKKAAGLVSARSDSAPATPEVPADTETTEATAPDATA